MQEERGTKRSIYGALVANLLIASSKFVVGFASATFACSSGRSKDSGRPWSCVVCWTSSPSHAKSYALQRP